MKTLMMIRKMKEVLTWVWIAVIGTAICLNVCAQTPQDWKRLEKQLNFYMANDLGRNGYYDQKPIAELMGEMADVIGPECVFRSALMRVISASREKLPSLPRLISRSRKYSSNGCSTRHPNSSN